MSIAAMKQPTPPAAGADIERVLIQGDLSKLTPEQRITYYRAVCESVGLNPLTRPFDYLTLNGKLLLYAKKDATEQLRSVRGISLRIISREMMDDCYVVTAEATDRSGRVDSATGAVSVGNLKGEAKANALMKAETKAKRRVTLSIAGLGLLDESETDSIPGAKPFVDEPRPATNTTARDIAAASGMVGVARIEAETGEIIETKSAPAFFDGVPNGLLTDEQVGEITARARDAGAMCLPKLLAAYGVEDAENLPASEFDTILGRIAQYAARRGSK